MRRLLTIAAVIALATAKPELYKEKEDFEYSRSSSDEGHKAGFYGAQRGNMGLNYEKSHNMDSLAQHQMSGAVRQVEGELGDASHTKSGSVYTSANSGGVYGSGRYDTSNLAGRNFNEGASYGDLNTHSSLSSHDAHRSQYTGSHHSGYTGGYGHNSGYHAGSLHSGSLQAADAVGAGGYDYEHNAEHSSGYQHQSGYTKQSSQGYGSNAHTRMIGNGVPARVVIRPGTTVYVPVAAQTYQQASSHDQNAIDTDTEVLSNANHHGHYSPSSDAKSYESSYNYRKEWEKHHEYPTAVPTMSPYPKNSELYEDARASSGSHNALSSSHYDRYNSNVKSSSAMQSHHNSGYNAAHDSSSFNAHSHGALNSDIGYAGDVSSKPKSYQSAYSYHKSWERQGDPYVIAPDGQTHGKITDASDSGKLCCIDTSYIRAKRSYDQNKEIENLNQQSQNIEDFGQQTQDLTQKDFGQQTQDLTQQDFGQQTQDLTQRDFGQQTQDLTLRDFGQQTQDLTQRDFGQQTQDLTLRDFGQPTQDLTQKDFGQQTQDFTQQSMSHKSEHLEDFGPQTQNAQQTQSGWQQNLGQQTHDLTQNTQTNWNQNLENLGQQTQDLGQLTENRWDRFTTPGQQTESQQPQDMWNTRNMEHEEVGQHSQNSWSLMSDFGQSMQGSWHHKMHGQNLSQEKELHTVSGNLNDFHQTTLNSDNYMQQNNWHQSTQDKDHDFGQETQDMWRKWDTTNQNSNVHSNNQVKPVWEQTADNRPPFSGNSELGYNNTRNSNIWKYLDYDYQNTNTSKQTSQKNSNDRTEPSSQGTSIVNLWDKINNLDQFSMSNNNQNEYQYSQGHRTLDNSFQNNWSHSFSRSDSGLSQSTNVQNHYGSYNGEFKPNWNSSILNENSSTEKDIDSLTQNTYKINSFSGYQERETTTARPKHNVKIAPVEASQPEDIGRGDIGPEESSVNGLTTNTKPQVNTNYANINPSTVSYAFENKRFKTPEEIETLSLTTQTEKIAINENISTSNKNITEYNNQQKSDSNLSVLSLQEGLNEQRTHDKNQYDSSATLKTSSTTPKSRSTYNKDDFNNQQMESHLLGTIYNSNLTTTTKPISPSQHKPKDVTDHTPKDLKHIEVHENTDMVQETQQLGDFASFVHENKNLNKELDQHNQQFESLGQFGQQSDNSDQQVQSSWGQDLVNLGQQQQSGWESRDYVQETQQLEKSGRFNEGQYQTQDFYNQRYTDNEKEHKEKVIIKNLESPQSPENVENMHTIQKTNSDTDTAIPPVPSTEKPGFWKSVGSKFSSAKDTVSSWFKKS